jgi:hypothetical protein
VEKWCTSTAWRSSHNQARRRNLLRTARQDERHREDISPAGEFCCRPMRRTLGGGNTRRSRTANLYCLQRCAAQLCAFPFWGRALDSAIRIPYSPLHLPASFLSVFHCSESQNRGPDPTQRSTRTLLQWVRVTILRTQRPGAERPEDSPKEELPGPLSVSTRFLPFCLRVGVRHPILAILP